ncbi:hypothetical protein PR202_gb27006 [Eleusine coracana subsp. coracana]|uniref:Uncharacterized protein n=1 Tax=Eleusine coracana subsp. coracana TaxID=191504 RepID=A0AAV5FTC3_ELECO|nr:hypothetical protein PR202_gb27006 [Eleusine coracana subsp. coracana]
MAMELASAAMTPLIEKLGELLVSELTIEKRVRQDVASLERELKAMHVALQGIEVPPEQLDEGTKLWAADLRELSYDMEDAIDAFILQLGEDDDDPAAAGLRSRFRWFLDKTVRLFSKGKALHQIAAAVSEAKRLAKELGEIHQRYAGLKRKHVGDASSADIDPRLMAMYTDTTDIVGVDGTRDELIQVLSDRSEMDVKTVSIVGLGGLGKTTLAKAVYDKIKVEFDCGAFVSVSRTPNITKILQLILFELDKQGYTNINEIFRDDTKQLIDKLRDFLQNKRLPKGFGNLTSLEELTGLKIDNRDNVAAVMSELGHLTGLRVLELSWGTHDVSKALIQSLGNLCKMQSLDVYAYGIDKELICGWAPPPRLRRFLSTGLASTLPAWTKNTSSSLTFLDVFLLKVRPEDIRALGALPYLLTIRLESQSQNCFDSPQDRMEVNAFPSMRSCKFVRFRTMPSMFPPGAMPQLQQLEFTVWPSDFADGGGVYELEDLRMGHLPLLEEVGVELLYRIMKEEDAKVVEAALRQAAEDHPNRFALRVDKCDRDVLILSARDGA